MGDGRWAMGDGRWAMGDGHGRWAMETEASEPKASQDANKEHFSIWSRDSTGTWRRRAHEYFDWGVILDPTCRDPSS